MKNFALVLCTLAACVTSETVNTQPDAQQPRSSIVDRCGWPPNAKDEKLTFAPTHFMWRDGTPLVMFYLSRYEEHVAWIEATDAWEACAIFGEQP